MMRHLLFLLVFISAAYQSGLAHAQGNLPGLPPMEDRFYQTAPDIGEILPDLTIVDDQGNPVRMRDLPVSGRYTVLVVGCLT